MATVSRKSGFDCEFVEKPPEAVQSECPVCLQILCEPYQISCCGNSFCRVCIERIKTDNKPCPTCNEENIVTFFDKRLQRSLYGFQVYCSHKQEGCEWKGELGQFDSHLQECKYSEFIDCDFHHVGCEVRLPRKDMSAHLKADLIIHMSLQAASYKQLQEKVNKLESENETLKRQLRTTQEESRQATVRIQKIERQVAIPRLAESPPQQPQMKQLAVSTSVPCICELTMDGYEEFKSDNDAWFSQPFYSHPRGYKFCLRVDANGNGIAQGTHLSVFTCLMKGEFDKHLKWPFCGKIVIQLVDQKGGKKHCTGTIPYTEYTPGNIAGRVTRGDRNGPWGKHQFLSQDDLKPNYLKNDRLCFRVTKFKFQ